MDIKPIIHKVLERGVGWLSKLISATDHSLTKASIFLQNKKKEIEDYLIDRNNLLSAIHLAQKEIDSLRSEIDKTSKEQTDNFLVLHEKLEKRTEELLNNQKQIKDLHKFVEKSKDIIREISVEKEQAVNERTLLRAEYNNLQVIINDNFLKQEEISAEILSLKMNTITGEADIKQEQIEEHEKRIKDLQKESIYYERRYNDIQGQLKEKMSLVVKLNGQLQQTEVEIRERESKITILEQKSEEYQVEIRNYLHQTKKLKKDLASNKIKLKNQRYKNVELQKYIKDLYVKLESTDLEYLDNMIQTEHEINGLKNDLLNEQNKLAIEKERNGAPAEITLEAVRILEQEYEPRFQTLYQSCNLHNEFYRDFFSLIPSDRLRVEACIVNLNFNYDQHMYKVRPNIVKTKASTTINEYPFGHDKVGRIYFKRVNGKVNFYRISRTKNGKGNLDQNRVIEWLKRNK